MNQSGSVRRGDNIYFASDLHLGLPDHETSLKREKHFVAWLDSIKNDASEIFLVGDLFDFWFEYKKVIPKGFTRFLGKLAELCDSGLPVHFFAGNHDLWLFDYLEQEIGVQIHRSEFTMERAGKKFYIAHGDGFGPGDRSYKFLKSIFTNRFMQWGFQWLHPNIGVGLAHAWSRKSRFQYGSIPAFEGEQEWLFQHSKEILEQGEEYDYFIYGHRHLPVDIHLNDKARMINLGDWVKNFTYAVFDGKDLELKSFRPKNPLDLDPDNKLF